MSGDASIDFSGSTPVAKLDDDSSEGDDSAEYFSSLGILSRPLPPETVNGVKYHAEALCIRSWDRMTPIGYRDTRLQMNGAGPKAGTVPMVGYGGGFLAFDPVLQSGKLKSSRAVLYCPYDFVNGTAQKAHAIILDTESGNESLSIIHSSGVAITMFNGNMVLKNKTGTATITNGNRLSHRYLRSRPYPRFRYNIARWIKSRWVTGGPRPPIKRPPQHRCRAPNEPDASAFKSPAIYRGSLI